MVTETNELDDSRNFEFDLVGNLKRRIDRLGRVIDFEHDDMDRVIPLDELDDFVDVPHPWGTGGALHFRRFERDRVEVRTASAELPLRLDEGTIESDGGDTRFDAILSCGVFTLGREPIRADADSLYDSMAIPHDTRWDLPLPSRRQTYEYMRAVRDEVCEALERHGDDPRVLYHGMYSVFHEDMHGEAFCYTRQTLGYPAPALGTAPETAGGGALPGDVEVAPPAGFELGARRDEWFVFDNEKWAHPAPLAPFAIARAPVTQGELAAFVDDGGYRRRELWSDEGWAWREGEGAERPVYWRRAEDGAGWQRRDFDRWRPLEPDRPMIHVCWHEAQAYCRWAGRRLPSEAEWEAAATLAGGEKRRFPWGPEAPTPERADLDGYRLGCVDAGALAASESWTVLVKDRRGRPLVRAAAVLVTAAVGLDEGLAPRRWLLHCRSNLQYRPVVDIQSWQ